MEQPLVGCPQTAAGRAAEQTSPCLTDLYEQKLRQGELLAARCAQCAHAHFPPEPRCPRCESSQLQPQALSGRGRLLSAQVAEHPGELSVGQVLLDDGLQIGALLVGRFANARVLQDELRDGPVDVAPAVLRTHGLTILAFEPA